MLQPGWLVLALVALVGGMAVILLPKQVTQLNNQLSRALGSVDDLVLRHRHVMGALLLLVAYLCFRLAMLVPQGLL